MRNLKRALSLTLASVMLLGMMVVGAGAAGYPDVDEEDNVEAIEVLQAVKVMVGDDNGNFDPDRNVSRTEMAVVMALLLDLDYEYYEASCPFWDVPTWARGYVGACYANKTIYGYSATTYGAADSITPVQAAAMMMRALGYFQYPEDTKDGFELSTVRQGSQIGIFDGVGSSATAPMTRNQVAKMALNALESEMVTFTGTPGTQYTSSNGETLSIGYRAEYTPRTSTEKKYAAIEGRTSDVTETNNHKGQYYIQLGEELYNGKLTKKYARDDFERPSINWQYDGKDIGTYVDYDLRVAEYTKAVKFSELYDLLTYTTINENNVDRYEDGVGIEIERAYFTRSNKAEVGGTGVLTEVFVDLDNDLITITSINTYLAKANGDYNKANESLSLNVYTGSDGAKVTSTTRIVDSKDVPEVEDVKKDDYVLLYMSGKDSAANLTDYNRFDVVKLFDVEIMSDSEITKFSIDGTAAGKKVVKKLTTNGTEYDSNAKAFYDYKAVLDEYDTQLLSDMSYNIYMDRYGNVIGVDLYEGAKNYVFITGYDRSGSNISVKTADAAAIFTDGTMDTITVNVSDTNKNIDNSGNGNYSNWTAGGDIALNRWYTYTVASNGNYTLKPVARFFYTSYDEATDFNSDGVKTLNSANLYLNDGNNLNSYDNQGRIYGNDDSIYITVEPGRVDNSCTTPGHDVNSVGNTDLDNVKDAITDVLGVYTGAQDVKIDLSLATKQEVNHNNSDGNGKEELGTGKNGEADAYVYSIYDSNYYIIASIVLGEAQGASANYVYVLGDAKNERVERGTDTRDATSDTYYWEFDAVMDGAETTLTVKSKYEDTINKLVPFTVQEVRYDGDYVTAIKNVDVAKIHTSNLTDEGDKDIEDMDVYDVGQIDDDDWASNSVGIMDNTNRDLNGNGLSDAHRINGEIKLVGRTLYTERPNDVGLALAADAKAVLIQPEDGKRVVTSCASVSDAIGRLADEDPDTAGTQFQGRIVAVLGTGAVAKWVVIISDTNLVTGKNPGYTGPERTGQEVGQYTTIAKVNELLEDGDVIVTGDWEPADADGSKSVDIPKGRTLTIEGSFDATDSNAMGKKIPISLTNSSKLVVDETLTVQQSLKGTVEAKDLVIRTRDAAYNFSIGGTVNVSNSMSIIGKGTVTVEKDYTVTIGGGLTSDGKATKLTVDGTMYVNEDEKVTATTPVSGTLTIVVPGGESLHITPATVSGEKVVTGAQVTLIPVGEGYIDAKGIVKGTYVSVDATRVQDIGGLEGETSLDENAKIASMEVFKPSKLAAEAGATITFTSSGESNVKFTDAGTGDPIEVESQTVVFGTGIGTVPTVSEDGKVTNGEPAEVTEGTTEITADNVQTNPITIGKSYFIYDEASWKAAYNDGVRGLVQTNGGWTIHLNATGENKKTANEAWEILAAEEGEHNGINTFPWLYVEVTFEKGVTGTLFPTITYGGNEKQAYTDGFSFGGENMTNAYLHWELGNGQEGTSHLDISEDAMVADYSISINWVLGEGEEAPEGQNPVAKDLGSYTKAYQTACEALKTEHNKAAEETGPSGGQG